MTSNAFVTSLVMTGIPDEHSFGANLRHALGEVAAGRYDNGIAPCIDFQQRVAFKAAVDDDLVAQPLVPNDGFQFGEGRAVAANFKDDFGRRARTQAVNHARDIQNALVRLGSPDEGDARSDAVIVPTRSNFTEGMPQVCAEAVLSGIPVITSDVTNAFDVIGPAIIQAITDDATSYVEAISSLIGNRAAYDGLQSACPSLALQFIDRSQSYPAALDRLLELVIGQPRLSGYTEVFKEIA